MKTATILFYVIHERIKIKQLKAKDKLIMQLPPHSGKDCTTNLQDNETIDDLIKRIPTSEGLYKLSWILTRKGDSLELDTNERKITKAKARSARDRAMHLLAIEQSVEIHTKEHTIAHKRAEREAFNIIQAHEKWEEQRAIRESKANDKSNKDNNVDDNEEEEGSEEMDSSGGKESRTHNTVVNVASLTPTDDNMDDNEEEEGSEEMDSSGGEESRTQNTMVNVASLTPTSHHKMSNIIDKLIMQLPPHSRQGCISNARDDKTIDEIISRISTSKGLYKMHWLLTEEAKSKELNDDERKLIKSKGESAKTKGMNLLAKEKNISRESKEHIYLHMAAQQEAMIGINESEKVDSSGEEEDSHLFSDSS